jgi:carboxyl-terminal processing protease
MKTLRYVCLFAVLLLDGMAVQKQNLQLASFDQVWSTIRERHWDQEKVGAAWDRARAELRPQAEQAQTPEQVRPIIAKLLATLGESHFYVIPAEAYDSMQNGGADGAAEPEFDFRILDGQAVVTRAAGSVQSGWILQSIEQKKTQPLIQEISAAIPSKREAELIAWAAIHHKLSGAANQTKSLAFVTGSGACKTLNVPLLAPRHMARFGNLPPFAMQIEFQRAINIGRFRFNAFLDPEWLQERLRFAVQDCAACAGFILDLRGNLGGLVQLAAATAAWFVPDQKALGTMTSRTGSMQLLVFPRQQRFSGKLAVLVDSLSVSSAEFLAAGLKDLGRARLFGEVTQGAALPSVIEKLPNGDRFQYAIAGYISASGAAVEGAGVTPDVIVRPNRNDYLAGHDPALDAARQWIETKE